MLASCPYDQTSNIHNYIKTTLLGAVCLLLSLLVRAEGSKDMYPSGASGYRAFLNSTTTATSTNPFPTLGTVKVYAKAGETIYVGSSALGVGNGTINLRAPNGNTYSAGSGGLLGTTGLIQTRNQELNGPNLLGILGTGYTPATFTVGSAEGGVWEIDFVPPSTTSGSNPTPITATGNWSQPTSGQYIAAFDVTVRNTANTAFLTGRVYMNIFSGILGDYTSGFNTTFTILTKDGFIYTVNNNGQAGNGFSFFVNNKGIQTTAGLPAYKSYNSVTSIPTQDPRADDTQTDITDKIFFTTPASDLPATSTSVSGAEWLLTSPVVPVASNISFTGIEGTPNVAGTNPAGGNFGFTANKIANYAVDLDLNGNGVYSDSVDRRITGTAAAGSNSVYWDGLDGKGNKVTATSGNSFSINVRITLFGGEVHFPFVDVERNVNGVIITRTNGTGSGNNIVYWDDTNITLVGTPSNPRKTTIDGVSSTSNGHKWGTAGAGSTEFGDVRVLDTWTYVASSPLTNTTTITLKQADLETVSVTSSASQPCVGSNITYTVPVRNNGPDAVTGAPFAFTYPTNFTNVSVTSAVTTGTASVSGGSATTTGYSANLNMNNGAVVTFTITGTVASVPSGGSLAVKASIMRPADVTDPDATNPDAAPPTDPQSECDAAPSGQGCNNIINSSIVIYGTPTTANAGSAQSLCAATSTTLAANTPTTGTGAWSMVSGPGTASFVSASNPGTVVNGLVAGTYIFRWTISNGNCTPSTSDVTVAVLAALAGNTITAPVTTSFCGSGDAQVITGATPTGGTGTYTYQWQNSTDGTNYTNISGATTISYDPPVATSTTYYRRGISSGACSTVVYSNVVTITIQPAIAGNTITAPATTTFCASGDASLISGSTPTGGSGTYVYQWQSSADSSTFNNISGATSAGYDPPAATATTYYRRLVTSGACTSASNSNVVTITVYAAVNAGTVGSDQAFCVSGDPAVFTQLTAATGGTGTYTVQWQSSVTSSTAGFSNISGAASATYDAPAVSQTTWFRRVVSSGTCTSANSNAITVTINPTLTAGSVGSNQTFCSGGDPAAFTQTAPTGGNGTYTYQWQSSTDNATFTNITSATASTYDAPSVSQTTYYRRAVSSDVCGPVYSNVLTVTIVPSITNNAIAAAQTICSGSAPAALAGSTPANGTGSYTYLWESSADGVSNFTTATGTSTGQNYTPGNLTQTIYYRRKVSSGACANATSNVLQITVNGTPTGANAGPDQGPANITSATLAGNNPTVGTGVWSQVSGPGTANIVNTAQYNTSVTNLVPGTYTFRWTITNSPCTASTDDVLIIVNQAPVAKNDTATTNEDVAVTIAVLSNDSDPDGTLNAASVTIVTAPSHGTATVNSNGTVVYTPAANYNGTDNFTYTVQDNLGTTSSPANVVVNITPVNDAPVAVNDQINLSQNTTVNISAPGVLGNDYDVDGDQLVASLVTNVTKGTLTLNGNGSLTYTPATGYSGLDSFTYRACDPSNACSTAKVYFNIGHVNSAPVANADSYTLAEDNTLTTTTANGVLANDTDADNDPLTATLVSDVSHGTLTLNTNGTFTYTPAANYNGSDQFSYKACDPGGACSQTVTVSFTVTAVNDKPVAQGNSYSVNEDQVLTVAPRGVLVNDNDVDGDTLSASVVTGPAHGTLVLKADGSFTYTPAANYNGVDQFTYRACDNGSPSLCDTALVSITVNPVNDAPVAANDNYTTAEDQALSVAAPGVLSNDTDVDNDALTAALVTNAAHGSVTLQTNGSFLYTPVSNYNGADSFTYRVCDPSNACATGVVYISVTPVNDTPMVVSASYTAIEDQVLSISAPGLRSNGSDADGDALTASLVTQAQHGTVTVNADGSFTYTPAANYNGADVFTYKLCDPSGACAQGTASVTVSPVNDAPVAVNDTYAGTEDQTLSVSAANGVLSNDTDADGDRLTASLLVQAAHGTVNMNSDGSFTYVPAANYNGTDSFTYQVCDPSNACATGTVKVNVAAVNDAPVATADSYTLQEDAVLTIAAPGVLYNDYDVDGDTLTATLYNQPVHGTITVSTNGGFVYTPAANFNGTDSFTYRACDGGGLCGTGTVTLTVTAVNDAPVAVNDTYTVAEDTRLDVAARGVLNNDTDVDGDTLSASVVRQPVHGTLTLLSNGSFSYMPASNYNGKDSFDYKACDPSGACSGTGTVVITVTAVNDAPVIAGTVTYSGTEDVTLNVSAPGVLYNASDPENDPISASVNTQPLHGTVTVNADGSFSYMPAANFNGTDTFTYKVCDTSGACSIGTAVLTIAAVNDAPVANSDVLPATPEDTPLNFPASALLSNDTDAEGDSLTASIYTQPLHGTLVQNSNGTFTYTPASNYNGVDTFTYRVCDNGSPSQCSVGTVTIQVTPVNDRPSAVTDRYNATEDVVLNVSAPGVLFNDSDPDDAQSSLTASLVRGPAHGSVTLNSNGSFSYTPAANYNGQDTFVYRVCDPSGACDTGSVILSVAPVNDAPVTQPDSYNLQEDTAFTATAANGVLANDTDVDGDRLSAALVSGPSRGSLVLNSDGSFTYTPNANYNGVDSFVYRACDPAGACTQGTVTLNIANVNDAPVTAPVSFQVNEDQSLLLAQRAILFADQDADGDSLTVTSVTQPVHGTLTQNGDDSYTYTPNANYNGVDSFTYTVSDGHGGVATGVVRLTVNPVNDAPVATDDAYQLAEGQTFTSGTSVLSNDTDVDGDALTASLLAGPAHGTITFGSNGNFTYTPDTYYNGTDSFTYVVSDGKGGTDTGVVRLTVTPVNNNPVANNDSYTTSEDVTYTANSPGVLFNDTDPDITTNAPGQQDVLTATAETKATAAGGTVQIHADGSFVYTPAANYNGVDSFTYTVNDGKGGSAQGTVYMTVQAVNDAPVAADDNYTLQEDNPLTTTTANGLLANDTDVDGDALTAALLAAPAHGTVTVNADGTFTYSPDANYNGSDVFTYVVSDGKGGNDTGTVTLTVTAVDDAPVAHNDNYYIATNDSLIITAPGVLQNDMDVDSPLSATLVSSPASGSYSTFTFNADGSFKLVPASGFQGVITFSYKLCDTCTPATVTVNVGTANQPPVATADSYTTAEDNALSVSAPGVLSNDTDPDEPGTPTLAAILVSGVSHGTLQLNSNGSFYYVPAQNYNGIDSFVYNATDANGATSQATVTIMVTAVNDAPVANNDTASVNEDTPLTGNVGTNDTDVDDAAATLTYTVVQNVSHGSLTLNSDGSFTYTPDANYNGPDMFRYQVCDPSGACSQATMSITVNAVNDAPVANGESYAVTEDQQLVVNTAQGVLANDSDVDGDPIAAVLMTTAHGTLNLNADGSFTYTPNANFAGVDSFQYKACDNGTPAQCSAPVTVYFNVANVNDAPMAGNDNYVIDEDNALTVAAPGVLANDTDADNNPLTAALLTAPAHGSLVLNADGSFTYTPNANYNGFDNFTYIVSDNNGASDTGVVSITINAVPDKPVTNADSYAVTEDSTLVVDAAHGVLANDVDVDGGTIVSILTSTSKGSLTLNRDGSFTYVPQPNANGVDSFTYQACNVNLCSDPVTVIFNFTNVNDAPVAVTDSAATTEDMAYTSTVSVLANDTDPDGTYGLAVTPQTVTDGRGTLVMQADGNYTFTPASNYNGVTEYAYQVCDTGGLCAQGRLIITVTPVNDAPVASADSYQLAQHSTLTVSAADGVLANDYDVDGETITATAVTQPTKGTLQLNADGSFIYTPQTDATGLDSFTYRACDMGGLCSADVTVTFSIIDVNDPPVANNDTVTMMEDSVVTINVLANDTDPDQGQTLTTSVVTGPSHGTLVHNSDGTFTYTPDANYNGTDYFTYRVCDDGTPQYCNTATVNITVTAVNDAPVAVADNYTMQEDGTLTIDAPGVLGNDSDPDGDAIRAALVTGAVHGNVTLNSDGSFTYVPAADYNGLDSFVYKVFDAAGDSATAVVTLQVQAVNDAPVANNDGPYTVNEDTVLMVNAANGLLANDTDVEGSPLTASLATQAMHGTVVVNADGSFTYTPDANYNGTDNFTYRVCDTGQLCSTGTVTITIQPQPDAPVVMNDSYNATEDMPLQVAAPGVLSNDSDPDGDVLRAAIVAGPLHGTVTMNADGSFVYTGNQDYNGVDSFNYSACDPGGLCTTGTVVLTVAAVGDAPQVGNLNLTATEDTPLQLSVDTLLSNSSDADGDSLSVVINQQPLHGTITQNADGSYTYTPAANYAGPDQFNYTVCDNGNPPGCSTGTVYVTVNGVNDTPAGAGDQYSVGEDSVLTVNAPGVLANDTDADGDQLTAALVTGTVHGTVTLNPDGGFEYRPEANYNGVDSFVYRACDPSGACSNTTVLITVNAVNDAPVAGGGNLTVMEDMAATFRLDTLLHNSDTDGDVLTSQLAGVPSHGTLVNNGDGTYTYTPAANYFGTDSVLYRVCDPGGLCDSGYLTIQVQAVNDAPVAVNDTLNTDEDTPLTFTAASLTANDSDPDGDQLTVAITGQPLHGTLTVNSDNTYTYTPAADFNGVDSIVYRVYDPSGAYGEAVILVKVRSVNDRPVVVSDAYSTAYNTPVSGNVLANDYDPDGDPLTASLVTQPAHGTIDFHTDGTFTYTPSGGFSGTETFTYQACDTATPQLCDSKLISITVQAPGNSAPQAVADSFAVVQGTVLNGNVLTNDIDADHDTLTATPVLQPAHGTLVMNSNGTFTYTPAQGYSGVDSFSYQACDNSTPPLCSSPVTVSVSVVLPNSRPVAVGDSYTLNEDDTLRVASPGILQNDVYSGSGADDTLTINIVTPPSHGTATIAANGALVYIPAPDFNGKDTMAYQICSAVNGCDVALIQFTVNAVNDLPVTAADVYGNVQEDEPFTTTAATGVLANDRDADGDVLTASVVTQPANGSVVMNADGSFTYTPFSNYNGLDSFVYRACDPSGGCTTGVVTLTVNAVNDLPVSNPVSFTVDEDSVLTITAAQILFNDEDADGDTLHITAIAQPKHGTLVQNGDGSYTYTPAANFNGLDSAVYTISDGSSSLVNGIIYFNVRSVNDAPVAVDDSYTVTEDVPFTSPVSVLANDTDADGDTLTAVVLAAPRHGTVSFNSDGTFTYQPNADYNGNDTLTYLVSDGKGGNDTGTVTFVITPVNDNPVANNDTYSVREGEVLTVAAPGVLFNDTDADISTGGSDVLSVTAQTVTTPNGGTVQLNANGSFVYTPAANFSGTDSFTYQLNDGQGGVATGTVVIAVQAVNSTPVANNDSYTLQEDEVLTGAPSLLLNDTDADGDTLTAALATAPAHGSVVVNADGTFTYTPDPDYNGPDSFGYSVDDGHGGRDTGTVQLTITPVDDAPVAGDDHYYLATDSTLTVAAPGVLANDVDVDSPLSAELVTNVAPAAGTLTFNADGSFVFVPAAGYTGNAIFTYRLCATCSPATVTIAVGAANLPPVAVADSYTVNEDEVLMVGAPGVIANDTDPDESGIPSLSVSLVTGTSHGQLTLLANGAFNYVPDENYNGTDSFVYQAKDANGATSQATVTITVNAVDDAPVSVNDQVTTEEDSTVTGNVLTNDIDVDDPVSGLTVSLVRNVQHGTLTLNANGTFTYVPDANYNGSDAFTYRVCDTSGLCSEALVSITVNSVNDAPVAVADSYIVAEDNQLVVPAASGVLANDSDPDNDAIVAVLATTAHGTLHLLSDGSFTYSPNADFNGVDSFTYKACDNGTPPLCSAPVTVTITVTNVNDAPVAVADQYITQEDVPLTVVAPGVLANDRDVDGDTLTASVITAPQHGTLVLNSDGSFVYTPNANYNGTDMFTYAVSDGHGGVSTAQVGITVTSVNDTPVSNPDTYTSPEDAVLTVTAAEGVLANDTDADGDVLIAKLVTAPVKGRITLNSDGSFTYIPDANANGIDSFSYQACDMTACGTPVTVLLNVTAVNDAPVAVNDTVTINENTSYTSIAPVTANDYDPDGPTVLTVTPLHVSDSRGVMNITSDGNYTYTPAANYSGTAQYTYQVLDATGLSATGQLVIIVQAVNQAPTALPDSYSMRSGDTLRVTGVNSLLTNDTDPDGNPLQVSLVTAPASGQLTLNADGTFVYIPASGFTGTVTFVYRACDNGTPSLCDTALVTLSVASRANRPPVANNDAYTVAQNAVLNGNVINNDTDPDGNTLTASVITQPVHGSLQLNADGTFVYTPTTGYSGADSFSYRICDNGTPTLCDTGSVVLTVRPIPLLGLAKALTNTKAELDGSYTLIYKLVVKNYGNVALSSVQVIDRLSTTFASASSFTVSSVISTTGGLIANGSYDGKNNTLLLRAGSTVAANTADTITFSVNVLVPAGSDNTYSNSALASAISTVGTVSDESTSGLDPDPDGNGTPDEKETTDVTLTGMKVKIPQGFSPNNDGINDYFVIENMGASRVSLEMYNRWGNLVYKNTDYRNNWDGRSNQGPRIGDVVPDGTYYYIVVVDGQSKYVNFITINR